MCSGYYRYDEGYTPEFAGDRALRRRGRPPPALARGPRLRRQARRRDRQRRHRGDAGAGDGREGGAGDDAAALARPTSSRCPAKTRSPTACAASCPSAGRLRDRALEERPAPDGASTSSAAAGPELMQAAACARGVEQRAAAPATTSTSTSSPRYNPWDQRLCLVPDGDLFKAISAGSAEIVTDTIETFTESGIELESGRGAGGRRDRHRDRPQPALPRRHASSPSTARSPTSPRAMTYKGMMLSGVPNFAFTLGYTNASWTLKADLTSEYICRLLNHMDAHGYRQCVPRGHRPLGDRASRCSTSPPATSCARSTSCPNRARRSRGSCARTTRSTCARCAAARSTTARCGSPARPKARRPGPRSSRPRPSSSGSAG